MNSFKFNLQLFANGAASAEGQAEGLAEDNGSEESKVNIQSADDGGKADVDVTSDTLDNRRSNFEKMIKGEYKELFNEKMQNVFNKRFRDYKTLQETNEASKPIIDLMMQKYGIEGNDLSGLREAIEGDNSYWEEMAEREGMSVKQFRELFRLRRENEVLAAERENREAESYAAQQMNEWLMAGEELKGEYPEFNFSEEIQNRDFQGLLKAGIPLKLAYEIMHKDEIMNNAVQSAQKETERKIVSNITQRAARPDELGMKPSGGFVLKKDVSALTRKEREELALRAQRGERVSF